MEWINISQVLSKRLLDKRDNMSQTKTSSHGSLFFLVLCRVELNHYLKAFGRYLFIPALVFRDLTVSNVSLPESSFTFKTIFFPWSLSDTPVALNVYSIPQVKLPVFLSSKILALPYLPVIVSTPSTALVDGVVPVAGGAKQLPFWRLVLMLVFSPSAKVKASDTCARAM